MGHGHAPCHATFWSLDDDLVIGGDQLLPSISPNLGVYATEPEADPVGEWLESCQRMLGLAETRHLVLPGHKLPFTGLSTRLRQLIDNHHGALDRMTAALRDRFWGDLVPGTAAEFLEAKLAERAARHQKQGGQRYVVEPNVKEGKGGLRDLHALFWIAKYLHGVRDANSAWPWSRPWPM